LSGRRPTDGVKDGLLKATMLLQHGNRSADDLEQVAGQLAQLAAAKINGEHMGADLTTAVKAIRELVVGMKKATETEVTQTQENIDELHNRILQCKKPSASASVIEDLEEDSEQQGVKHANCQSALKAKQDNLDQCNSLVETLKKSKESLCQAVEDMSPNPGVCEANDGDSYKSWVERLAGYFDTKMKEYEDKEEKCTDAKRDYEGNKSRCGTLQDGVTGKQDTCDAVARELNTKGCLAASTRADVCNQYHCCYTSSTGAYEVAVTNGRQEETAFIAYWTAMAHIECLLDVLVAPDASTDKIDACLSKKIDTTPVELSYPTVPDKEHCEGPSVYPCVPKWMEDHKLKDKSCVPCQGIKDSDSCGTGGDNGGGAGGGNGGGASVPMQLVASLEAPKGEASCEIDGEWLKASGGSDGESVGCMLGNADGTPLVVDYTKATYTRYRFTIKMDDDDNPKTITPSGGFIPCNMDGMASAWRSSPRTKSPELAFYGRAHDWGWGLQIGSKIPGVWSAVTKYTTLHGSSSDPSGGKELPFDLTMKWDGSKYTIYKWKVADDEFPLYQGENSGCDPSASHGFTPRLWAFRGNAHMQRSVFYMKDFVTSQSNDPQAV